MVMFPCVKVKGGFLNAVIISQAAILLGWLPPSTYWLCITDRVALFKKIGWLCHLVIFNICTIGTEIHIIIFIRTITVHVSNVELFPHINMELMRESYRISRSLSRQLSASINVCSQFLYFPTVTVFRNRGTFSPYIQQHNRNSKGE